MVSREWSVNPCLSIELAWRNQKALILMVSIYGFYRSNFDDLSQVHYVHSPFNSFRWKILICSRRNYHFSGTLILPPPHEEIDRVQDFICSSRRVLYIGKAWPTTSGTLCMKSSITEQIVTSTFHRYDCIIPSPKYQKRCTRVLIKVLHYNLPAPITTQRRQYTTQDIHKTQFRCNNNMNPVKLESQKLSLNFEKIKPTVAPEYKFKIKMNNHEWTRIRL